MTDNEILERWQPRQLESQKEFDAVMIELYSEQTKFNIPLAERKRELQKKRDYIMLQKNALMQQMLTINIEFRDIEYKQKHINGLFHEIKKGFISLNPKGFGGGQDAENQK